MSKRPTLSFLLFSSGHPTVTLYDDVTESVVERPEQLSTLLTDDNRDAILVHIATCGDRLARFFHLLHSRRLVTSKMATHIVALLISLVPSLYELIDETTLLKLVVCALRAVLPCCPPMLGNLMTVLMDCGNLMKQLIADSSCSEVIRDWAHSSRTTIQDSATLEMWTSMAVEMAASCPSDHGLVGEIQRWGALATLKTRLLELELIYAQQTGESQYQLAKSDLPLLASMTQLTQNDKKTQRALQQQPQYPLPDLKDEVVGLLTVFSLPVPSSWRSLRNTIEILESEETITILCAAIATFPCRLCKEATCCVPRQTGVATLAAKEEDAELTQKPGLDVLGKRMGNWKVLLSKQALKSMQNLNRSGLHSHSLSVLQAIYS
jgi:hypothetical protein